MINKTKIYGILTAGLIIVIVLYSLVDLRQVYMVAFHKTGIVGNFNSKGKIEGKFDTYLNGKVVRKANAKDGVLDGWSIDYYPSGNMKIKSFFKKGKHDGIEYAYYENGKLMYTRNWVKNKLYGDQYFYYQNGKVRGYHTYDILGGKFYLSHYDESGKRSQSDGYPFSSNIYSKSIGSDSSIVLKNSKKYDDIHDLYITLANPPHAYTPAIKVVINKKDFKNITFIGNNTAKIVNAFPEKGKYDIVLEGAFLDKSNLLIGDSDLIGEFNIVRNQ